MSSSTTAVRTVADQIEAAIGPVARRRLWFYAVAAAHRGYWEEGETICRALEGFADIRHDVLAVAAFMTWRRTRALDALGRLQSQADSGHMVARLLLGYVHLESALPSSALDALQAVMQGADPVAQEMAVFLERQLCSHLADTAAF